MAKKKKSQSLSERINRLANAIGAKVPPDLGKIKGELVQLGVSAEALEEGTGISESESKIATVEQALEQSNAENEKLKAELRSAQVKARNYKEELKRKEDKKWDIPDIQFSILQWLPSELSGSALKLTEVARDLKIPVDEAEIHFDTLRQMGLATALPNEVKGTTWRRSMEGNKFVVAKRWAGEGDPPKENKPGHGHPDLSKPEQIALLLMTRNDGEGAFESEIANELGISVLATTLVLSTLRGKEMATDGGEPQATYGQGQKWWLLTAGKEYLAERGLL